MPTHFIYHHIHTSFFVISVYSSPLALGLITRLIRASFIYVTKRKSNVEIELIDQISKLHFIINCIVFCLFDCVCRDATRDNGRRCECDCDVTWGGEDCSIRALPCPKVTYSLEQMLTYFRVSCCGVCVCVSVCSCVCVCVCVCVSMWEGAGKAAINHARTSSNV